MEIGWIQLGLQLLATIGAIAVGYARISSRLTALETRQQLLAERTPDLHAAIRLEVMEQLAQHQRDCPAAQDAWISPSGIRRNPIGGGS